MQSRIAKENLNRNEGGGEGVRENTCRSLSGESEERKKIIVLVHL